MYLLKINVINADIFSANDSTSCIPMLHKMTAKSDALFIFVHLEELDNIVIRITIVTFGILFTLARKIVIHQRWLDNRHVTNFYQSDSSLNMLDPENFPKARVVGFPWFVFNELSWNPSQWFDVKILFLEESSF